MQLRVHTFFHVSFERLSSIYDWLFENNCKLSSTNFFDKNHKIPDLNDLDMLIILGGPMSVNDEDEYPWLKEEKKFIRQVMDSGKPVLGICLGAQMIANILGAKVYKNKFKEIGWFDINFNQQFLANDHFRSLPQSLKLFHWHGEIFDMPEAAVNIGSSEATKNQGFIYGDNVVALQFHPEANISACTEFKNNCMDELKLKEPYIQCAEQITKDSHEYSKGGREFLFKVLDYLKMRVTRA